MDWSSSPTTQIFLYLFDNLLKIEIEAYSYLDTHLLKYISKFLDIYLKLNGFESNNSKGSNIKSSKSRASLYLNDI